MNLASIQIIKEIRKHPNADTLDIVKVLGFECIVRLNQYKVGEKVVFIFPDTVLPDAEWSGFYKAKSNRVKCIKLRNVWSEGIVESLSNVGLSPDLEVGVDVTELLKVEKYSPPLPQDLNAVGGLPFGICQTDEERFQSFDQLPYGEKVDVLQKYDGQSASFVFNVLTNSFHVIGRTMEYNQEKANNYTRNALQYNVKEKLSNFCLKHNISLAVRGESYGQGIQKFGHNPHAKLPLGWAMFSVWKVNDRKYALKGDPFYFLNIAEEIGLPTVDVLERDVILTPELIKKYREDLTEINGKSFEGVVIQHKEGSFKVINALYDSKK